MGKSAPSSFVITTERTAYSPGETVSGVIQVTTASVKCRLMVAFRGNESCTWTERHSTGTGRRRRTCVRHFRGECEIINVPIPLEASMNIGVIQIPFSFNIPKHLPSSFAMRILSVSASIGYAIDARLVEDNIQILSAVSEIRIRSLPSVIESCRTSITLPVTVCCCFNRGEVDLDFTLVDPVVPLGGVAEVHTIVNNRSTKNFQRVIASVYVVLDCSTGSRSICHWEQVAETVVEGIPAGQTDPNRRVFVNVPPNCCPTAIGTMVKVSYRICLRVDVSWGFDPTTALPLYLYEPPGGPVPVEIPRQLASMDNERLQPFETSDPVIRFN